MTIREVYYDTETNKYFYGPAHSQFRAAKDAVKVGVRNSRIICIGDNTTAGAYGQGGTTAAWGSNNRIFSWPKVLADKFASLRGLRAKNNSWFGDKFIPTLAEIHAYDNRVTYTGTWTLNESTGIGGQPYQSSTSGDQLTFVPDDAFDTIEVYTLTSPGSVCFVAPSIDAGPSLGNISGDGPAGMTKFTRKKALGSGTVKLTVQAGATSPVIIVGIVTYDSTQKEITIINAGITAASTETFAWPNAPWDAMSELAVLAPDLVIIDSTINESWYGTEAYYRSNLQTILNRIDELKYDALIVTGNPQKDPDSGVLQTQQDSFVNMCRLMARDNNVPLVDVFARWGGTWPAANALGFIDHSVDPKGAGYADIAAAVFAALD